MTDAVETPTIDQDVVGGDSFDPSTEPAMGSVPFSRPEIETLSTTDPSLGEVFQALRSSEDIVTNIAEAGLRLFTNDAPVDPDYDPFDDMDGYEGWDNRLMQARSREEMAQLKSRIDKETANNEVFAAGSTMEKFLSLGGLIATDPTMLIPVGGTAYKTYRVGGRILEGGAKTAGVTAAIVSGQEALLHTNQITRTGEESLYNVSAGVLLGGLLGGAAAGLSKAEFGALAKRLEEDLITPEAGEIKIGDGTVGAARVGKTLEGQEIKGLDKTKKVIDQAPDFLNSPVAQGMVSPSLATRDVTEKLADVGLVLNKNATGTASEQSVETLVKMYDVGEIQFYDEYNKLWKQYKTRVKSGLIDDAERIGSGKGGILTRKEFDAEIGKANRRNDTHVISEVQASAQAVRRTIFDPILNRAKEVGIFNELDDISVTTADSWLKRMYDKNKIVARRGEFKDRVMTFLKKERDKAAQELKAGTEDLTKKASAKLEKKAANIDEELDDIAEQIIDRITNATMGRLPYDNKIPSGRMATTQKRGSAKARVFNIPDADIEDFLVSDIHAIVRSHVRTMAPDNEIMGKFGHLDFDRVKKDIQDDWIKIRTAIERDTKLSPKAKEKKLQAAEKDLQRDIKNTQYMWEKLRGTFAVPDDYASPLHVAERVALGWNFTRLLGDVVASSFPDIGRPVMIHGLSKSYGDLFVAMIKDIDGLKMAMKDVADMGTVIDIVNSTTALRRAGIDEYMPVTGKIDEFTSKVSGFTAKATGISHWNSFMKTISGVIIQNAMLRSIIKISEGVKIPTKELEFLTKNGIGSADAKIIAAEFAKSGEKRGNIFVSNARIWENSKIKNKFMTAVRQEVDHTILTPGLERPIWMSKPGFRLIGNLKSFTFAANHRIVLAGLQQADANIVTGILISTALGALTYAWKQKFNGREISKNPGVIIAEGIDRSGITGIMFDVNNFVEKATRGTVGINALMGGPQMSRYASRNSLGALLGPSFGLASTLLQVSGAAASGDFSQSDTHAVRKLMPLNNAPYLRGLFDDIEKGTNKALNIHK